MQDDFTGPDHKRNSSVVLPFGRGQQARRLPPAPPEDSIPFDEPDDGSGVVPDASVLLTDLGEIFRSPPANAAQAGFLDQFVQGLSDATDAAEARMDGYDEKIRQHKRAAMRRRLRLVRGGKVKASRP